MGFVQVENILHTDKVASSSNVEKGSQRGCTKRPKVTINIQHFLSDYLKQTLEG